MSYATGKKAYSNLDSARISNDIKMGDKIFELWPDETPFLTICRKVKYDPTPDPNPKKIVHKSGWADRRFFAAAAGTWSTGTIDNLAVDDGAGNNLGFLIKYLLLRIKTTGGDTTAIIDTVDNQGQVDLTAVSSSPNNISDNDEIQIIGTAFPEGSDKATAVYDTTTTQQTRTQIFKTVVDVTGTLQATETYGMSEYERLMNEKMREHKTDIERAMHFAEFASSGTTIGTDTVYTTQGIVPFIENNSSTSNVFTPSYGSYTFDDYVDDMEDWYTKGGNQSTSEKLCLSGSGVISFYSKMGSGKLWANTDVNISHNESDFGVNVTSVTHPFGTEHIIHSPVLRGNSTNAFYKNYKVGVDLNNVSYRPLKGNSYDRDTHLARDLQTSEDRVIHEYRTEVALQPVLEETHALFKFS